jgi:hypothetical protein
MTRLRRRMREDLQLAGHTWTRAKEYHPHLHMLVPAGGLDKDGVWRPARKKFLVPVKALSPIFRAIFMKLARKTLPNETFRQEVWDKEWVVFSRPTFKKTKKVLNCGKEFCVEIIRVGK